MLVKTAYDTYRKLTLLGVHSRFDVCSLWEDYEANLVIPGVYHAKTSRGSVPILKVLFTNHCERNCNYCANRRDRDVEERISFGVEELVRLTLDLYRKGYIRGIFLSSGTGASSLETFERMGEVARRLRRRGFCGYIHLKVLPGVPLELARSFAPFVNRFSYNLEAPSPDLLRVLSTDKSFSYGIGLLSALGGTTQFVVDYGSDGDGDYLRMVRCLYERGIKRVYFKAFVPIKETPMEGMPPGSRLREHRLYQASFLIRDYGFSPEDLLFEGRLPLGVDPKTFWAERHPEFFPVDLARADYRSLLRVPGIGPKTARKIIRLRSSGELGADGLLKLLPKRAIPYVIYRGRRIPGHGDTLRVLPLFFETGPLHLPDSEGGRERGEGHP